MFRRAGMWRQMLGDGRELRLVKGPRNGIEAAVLRARPGVRTAEWIGRAEALGIHLILD
jgi:hypothetical protein